MPVHCMLTTMEKQAARIDEYLSDETSNMSNLAFEKNNTKLHRKVAALRHFYLKTLEPFLTTSISQIQQQACAEFKHQQWKVDSLKWEIQQLKREIKEKEDFENAFDMASKTAP